MNKITKYFPTDSIAAKSVNETTESLKSDQRPERILSVDIKTLRTHMGDDNFNNCDTLLEVFGKCAIRIAINEIIKIKLNRFALLLAFVISIFIQLL